MTDSTTGRLTRYICTECWTEMWCPKCGLMRDGRDAKDYAVEFGEYLAKAAERFQDVMQDVLAGADDLELRTERWRALDSAIYEFRKRAKKRGVINDAPK